MKQQQELYRSLIMDVNKSSKHEYNIKVFIGVLCSMIRENPNIKCMRIVSSTKEQIISIKNPETSKYMSRLIIDATYDSYVKNETADYRAKHNKFTRRPIRRELGIILERVNSHITNRLGMTYAINDVHLPEFHGRLIIMVDSDRQEKLSELKFEIAHMEDNKSKEFPSWEEQLAYDRSTYAVY